MDEKPVEIKFSHVYEKMPDEAGRNKTYLMAVLQFWNEQVCEKFFEWDTRIVAGASAQSHYTLPQGRELFLLLGTENDEHNGFVLWATCRSFDVDKEKYYRSHLGEEVKIVITEEKS